MAKNNIYVIFDKVADEVILIGMCKTDGLFVRQNLPYVQKMNPNYLEDLNIFRIGDISDTSLVIDSYTKPVLVPWESYRSPEAKTPALEIS